MSCSINFLNEETKNVFNLRLGETYLPKGSEFHYIKPFCLMGDTDGTEVILRVRGIYFERTKIEKRSKILGQKQKISPLCNKN